MCVFPVPYVICHRIDIPYLSTSRYKNGHLHERLSWVMVYLIMRNNGNRLYESFCQP